MIAPLSKTNSGELASCPDRSGANGSVASTSTHNGVVDDFSLGYRVLFWAIALGLGLLRALDSRFSASGDGRSCIEMGDAYLRRDTTGVVCIPG